MDQKFWEEYYKRFAFHHSPFAEFCMQYLKAEETLLDVGCGRGKDSIFFLEKGLLVDAIDWVGIEELELLASSHQNFIFEQGDLTALKNVCVDNLYLRFLLHSITEEEETFLLDWASRNVVKKLFIETRSIKDPKGILVENNIYKTDHCRRFIDAEKLADKVEKLGFKILYFIEDRGLAPSAIQNKYSTTEVLPYTDIPQSNEDPILIRLVAEKI